MNRARAKNGCYWQKKAVLFLKNSKKTPLP